MAYFIISYDIRCPKRLQKIARYLENEGIRLQYSVFLVKATQDQIQRIVDELALLMADEDDIRVYKAPPPQKIQWLGRDCFGEGVWYEME